MWVEFVRQDRGAEAPLSQLLAADRVAINEIVRAELLIGARDHHEFQSLGADLAPLPHLAIEARGWEYVAGLGFSLRRKGITCPLPDLAVAACAIIHECELFSLDRDFELIARHAPLRIYQSSRKLQR